MNKNLEMFIKSFENRKTPAKWIKIIERKNETLQLKRLCSNEYKKVEEASSYTRDSIGIFCKKILFTKTKYLKLLDDKCKREIECEEKWEDFLPF